MTAGLQIIKKTAYEFGPGKFFRLDYDKDSGMLVVSAKNQTMMDELVEAFSVENPSAFYSQQYGYSGDPVLYNVNPFGYFLPGLLFEVLDWIKTQYGSLSHVAVSAECAKYVADFVTPLKKEIMAAGDFELRDLSEEAGVTGFQRRAYQDEAVEALLKKGYGRGMIEIPTAGGKSYILANLIWNIWKLFLPDARVLVFVPNIQLVDQLTKDFVQYGIPRGDIAMMRGGMSRKEAAANDPAKAKIVIGSRQYLVRHADRLPPVDVLICDEAHTCQAGGSAEFVQSLPARLKFGCSGTLPRDKYRRRQLVGLLGRIVYRENPMDLQEGGFISKLRITTYDIMDKVVEADRRLLFHWDSEIKYSQSDDCGINFNEAVLAEHEYFAKWYSKLYRPVLDKAASMPGNTLVLFDKIDIGRSLYEEFKELHPERPAFYTDGRTKVGDREEVRTGFEASDGNVLFSNVQIMSTGVSIKRLYNVVFCFSSKSTTRVIQSIGRVLRLYDGKDEANLVDCVFNTKYSRRHYNERRRLYREFYGKREPDEIVRVTLD